MQTESGGEGRQGKTLRCRLGRHVWVTRVDGGARWQECGRCGKYTFRAPALSRFPPGGMGESGGSGAG